MKIVISPAKSLNFERVAPQIRSTQPCFLAEASKLQQALRKKTPKQLSDLMGISAKLADLNWQRNQDWQTPFTIKNAYPAVFAFDGDVYSGLDVFSLSANKLSLLQERLRILSGLYGILKPFDLMQAYRLEMGTKLDVESHKNLYEFWRPKIANALNEEISEDEIFINLASTEYFKSVNEKELKVPVVTPEFREFANGKSKMISFFAKKARGLMVRFIIDQNIQTVEELKSFNYERYRYEQSLSQDSKLVFVR